MQVRQSVGKMRLLTTEKGEEGGGFRWILSFLMGVIRVN